MCFTATSDKFTATANVRRWRLVSASFYRAMLCKRGLCCHAVSVCPSVRLSVTFVDHVKTNKHISEIFSPSGSDTILVFPSQRWCRYSDGNRRTNARGYDKMTIFSQTSRSVSETVIGRWAHAARQFVSIEFFPSIQRLA